MSEERVKNTSAVITELSWPVTVGAHGRGGNRKERTHTHTL